MWIRVWKDENLSDIGSHLMIVGDLTANCASCKELNLDYKTAKQCPQCGTAFKYVTSRRFESHPGERFQIVKRLHDVRQDLTWIDYDDYKKLTGREKAKEFFGS